MPKLIPTGLSAAKSGQIRAVYEGTDEEVSPELEETKRIINIGFHRFCKRKGISPIMDSEWDGDRNYKLNQARQNEQPN